MKNKEETVLTYHFPVEIINEVLTEAYEATIKFPPFNSAHEGYAVILEELDELWDEIKKNPKNRDIAKMHAEAKQVAAMALRFMVDITDKGKY